MIKNTHYTTPKSILIGLGKFSSVSCVVSNAGVLADSEGRKVIKAGTPLYGATLETDRQTPMTISSTGSSDAATKVQGLAYTDIEFENGATTANGALVVAGTVDYEKLDTAVQALVTSAVKTALTRITFVKGRKD